MSKGIIFFLLIFIFSNTLAYCQEEQVVGIKKISEEELKELEARGFVPPPGMEITRVKRHNILLPKGIYIYQKGGAIYWEGISEYVSRKLFEMKEHFTQIGTEQKELKKEIEELKKIIGQRNRSDVELISKNLIEIDERFAQIETERAGFEEEIEQLEAFNTSRGSD